MISGDLPVEGVRALAVAARAAARRVAKATDAQRRTALEAMARAVREQQAEILAANALDIEAAVARGLSAPMVDRLRLDEQRIAGMVAAIEEIAGQDDLVG